MKKILAIIPDNVDGCVYHRIQVPLVNLKGFDLTQVNQLDGCSDATLMGFDLLWFNRLNGVADVFGQVDRLKRLGLPYVVDFDDYWALPQEHILYKSYRDNDVTHKLVYLIKNAAHVIVTHEHLAAKTVPLNKNVTVVRNAIDPTQPQWETSTKVTEGHTVFGWCGGESHRPDLELLKPTLKKLHEENKTNLMLGGYSDTSTWIEFATWFTNDKKYDKCLVKRGQDVYSYGQLYDYMTTCLIPLRDSTFNRCKSELKMLEAGFKKKAVIVSNVMPYTYLITGSNCLAVNSDKHWYKLMKRINDSKYLEQDLAGKLYEDVSVKYHINTQNLIREQIFRLI